MTGGTAGRRQGRHALGGRATTRRPQAGRKHTATSPTTILSRAIRKQALEERGLIRAQMRLGAGLIAFGTLSIPLFQLTGVLEGETATAAFAVATGVIGAGAAMLPTGAAAGASARLRSLPDHEDTPDDLPAARNGEIGNGRVTAGTSSDGH